MNIPDTLCFQSHQLLRYLASAMRCTACTQNHDGIASHLQELVELAELPILRSQLRDDADGICNDGRLICLCCFTRFQHL